VPILAARIAQGAGRRGVRRRDDETNLAVAAHWTQAADHSVCACERTVEQRQTVNSPAVDRDVAISGVDAVQHECFSGWCKAGAGHGLEEPLAGAAIDSAAGAMKS
jgi:hypothetical protein